MNYTSGNFIDKSKLKEGKKYTFYMLNGNIYKGTLNKVLNNSLVIKNYEVNNFDDFILGRPFVDEPGERTILKENVARIETAPKISIRGNRDVGNIISSFLKGGTRRRGRRSRRKTRRTR